MKLRSIRIPDTVLRAAGVACMLLAAYAAVRFGIGLCALSEDQPHPFWMWPIVAGCCYAYWRFFRQELGRVRWQVPLFAFAFLLFQIVGRQYDLERIEDGGLTVGGFAMWMKCAGVAALLTPVVAWPLSVLARWLQDRSTAPAGEDRPPRCSDRAFLGICVLAMMLAWQPYHWAYFPGLVEYDSGYQLWQSWNGLYNASNPLLHTLILGRFYLVGEKIATASGGIAAFCFVQRLFVSGCIAYALLVLRRNRAPMACLVAALAFFCALPVFGMLAISCTKDVPYYSLTLVQMSMIFDGCRNLERVRRKRYWIALGVVTAFACLFRANALVAMFAIAPLIVWAIRNRQLRRLLAVVMLASVAVAWGVNGLLIAVTRADRPLLRESLSVPVTQLARVYTYRDDAKADIENNYGDMVQTPLIYMPFLADHSKWAFTLDMGNVGRFFGLWFRYLGRYPRDYLDAFLLLSKGYWYLGDQSYARIYGDSPEQRTGAIPSRVSPDIETIVENCRLPGFKAYMERMYTTNEYLNIPVYRLLLCPALYVWAMLLCAAIAAANRRWDVGVVGCYGAVLLLALLLGPCCILRYAFLYMLLAPVLPGMLLAPKEGLIAPDAELRVFGKYL